MRVRIAKLGQPVQSVEVAEGSTVSKALKEAGFDLDAIKSIKKNSSPVQLTAVLSDGDTLLVSSEKIKGGRIVKKVVRKREEAENEGIILLGFDVEEVNVKDEQELIAYDASMDMNEIIREYLVERGYSMNDFVAIVDENGNQVEELVEEGRYTIQVESN